jgi:hypothetical protein
VIDGRAGETFYFAGDEIPPSRHFRLMEKSGEVLAEVSPGRRGLSRAGAALITPSVFSLVAATVLTPFAALNHDPDTQPRLALAAGLTAATGVAALVAGIALAVAGETRYHFESYVAPDGVRF